MKKTYLIALIVLTTAFAACETLPEQGSSCENKEQFVKFLIEKPDYWKVSAYVFDENDQPVPGLNDSCVLNSKLIFKNGILTEPYGCDGTILADSGSYAVGGCGKTLHLNTITFPNTDFTIIKITGEKLIVTFPFAGTTLRAYANAYR